MNLRIFVNQPICEAIFSDIYETLPADESSLGVSFSSVHPLLRRMEYALYRGQSFFHSLNPSEYYLGFHGGSAFLCKYSFPLAPEYLELCFKTYDAIVPYFNTVKCSSLAEQYKVLLDSSRNSNYAQLDLSGLFLRFASEHPEVLPLVPCAERAFSCRQITTDLCILTRGDKMQELFHFLCTFEGWFLRYTSTADCDSGPGADLSEQMKFHKNTLLPFLLEAMMRVWLWGQEFSIKEEALEQHRLEEYEQLSQRTELVKQYVALRTEPVINQLRLHPTDNFFPELATTPDFAGRIPIWICWWQGIEELPDLCQGCIHSLRMHLPMDKVQLHFITLENCQEYVTFSESIIDKFNSGKITLTHLSDLLRVELLHRYGGMWVDATIFLTRPLPEDFWQQELFTPAFSYSLFGYDIPRSRWTPSLWYVKDKGHPLFAYLTRALMHYWEYEDELVHYFLIDYLIDLGIRSLLPVQEAISACLVSPDTLYNFQIQRNQAYRPAQWKKIEAASYFYKCNRRENYLPFQANGQLTNYGYFLSKYAPERLPALPEGNSGLTSSEESRAIQPDSMSSGDKGSNEASTPILQDSLKSANAALDDCTASSQPTILSCAKHSPKELLALLSEQGPSFIIDQGLVLSRMGFVSRSALADYLLSEYALYGVSAEASSILPLERRLYDRLLSPAELEELTKKPDVILCW